MARMDLIFTCSLHILKHKQGEVSKLSPLVLRYVFYHNKELLAKKLKLLDFHCEYYLFQGH